MAFDPLSWALGWALNKTAQALPGWLGKRSLSDDLRATVSLWAAALPVEEWVHPDALFPNLVPDKDLVRRPALNGVRQILKDMQVPQQDHWNAALREHWRIMRDELGPEAQPFFLLHQDVAYSYLDELASKIYVVCCGSDPLYRVSTMGFNAQQVEVNRRILDVLEQLKQTVPPGSLEANPNHWLPLEGYRFLLPPSLSIEKGMDFFTKMLLLALYDTFALSGYMQFISTMQCSHRNIAGTNLRCLELLSHQLDFLAAARQRTHRFLSTLNTSIENEYDDTFAELKAAGWTFEVVVPISMVYRPALFLYDSRNKVIAIRPLDAGVTSNEMVKASSLLKTSDQLRFMCRIAGSEGGVVDVNFDKLSLNPAALRFLFSIAAEKTMDFSRIRIHRSDYEKWDYLLVTGF